MYLEIKPSQKLKNYIESFWMDTDVKEDRFSMVEPDGCFDIVIYMHELKNRILLTGIWDEPVQVSAFKGVKVFGVRFYPKSLETFFSMSIGELRNINIEVDHIKFKKDIDIELLKYSKDTDEMISFFELILEELLTEDYSIINQLMTKIDFKSPVDALSESIGVSRRHLSRVTKHKLGVTPKSYINILRFIKAKKMLLEGASFSDIIFECGYYDQSHFSKAFKRYTGKTPNEYTLK